MSTANIIDPSELAAMAHQDLACYSIVQWPGFERAAHHEKLISKLEAVERGENQTIDDPSATASWEKSHYQLNFSGLVSW